MINLNEYINDLAKSYDIDEPGFLISLSKFLVSNNWFGSSYEVKNGQVFVDESFISNFGSRLDDFCNGYLLDYSGKVQHLCKIMTPSLKKTTEYLLKYAKETALDKSVVYQLADFLLYSLPGEIDESTDTEIGSVLEDAFDTLPKAYGDILTDFINWVKQHTRTVYQATFFMEKYTSDEESSTAYSPDGYLEILYHLYNSDYIDKNDMYFQAASSKNYADAWLFLALHFLCALRNTDLQLLPHPRLTAAPDVVLSQISNGDFSDEDAKLTLYSITWTLESIMPTPNKTKRYSGVASIKLHVPQSVEVHIGTLFAAAEAHFQLTNYSDPNRPLIRIISTYEQISRYMGNEIGDLFLESNFHSRAANKSYMQMVCLLTDDILGVNDEFNVKGYMLAALARSHKGSYGDFAKTTSIYLKDAKMSGFSPEFVARELFERGVLSSIPSMMLKMITDGEYNKLSISNQTKMMQELHMSPSDVERTVKITQQNMKQSLAIVDSIYKKHSREELLNILHKIGNGGAASKCDGCMCLMSAMNIVCPFPDNRNCPTCKYEISTKSTMYLMARECKRLQDIYKTTDNSIEKERCKALAQDIVIPSIEEMLTMIKEDYGEEALRSLENIITEVYG